LVTDSLGLNRSPVSKREGSVGGRKGEMYEDGGSARKAILALSSGITYKKGGKGEGRRKS